MAWDKKLQAWVGEGPGKECGRGPVAIKGVVLVDGETYIANGRISPRGLKLIRLALRIAPHI